MKYFFNSPFNNRMLKTLTRSYRDYICEFTHAHIKHYSFIIDVNLIVYIGGQTWQHRKSDLLTDFRSASLQRS